MASSSSPVHTLTAPRLQRPGDVRPLAIEFPSWPVTILAVPILMRAAIFSVALIVEPWSANPDRIIPAWAQILQASCFGALAFVLLRYGRDDRRAWSLGLFILDAASTLLTPFVRAIETPSAMVWVGLHLRTDAFQAALVWFFASLFPRSSTRKTLAVFFNAMTALAFVLGVGLMVFDTLAQLAGSASQSLWSQLAVTVQREAPGQSDWYFTLQFLLLAPLVIAMPLKLSESGPDDRRRFMWLAIGIVVGLLPLVGNTVFETAWPWYAGPTIAPPFVRARGAVIVIALTALPIAGAYAALVQRTLDVRLVLRRALQYLFARTVIRGLAAAPFLALIVLVVFNRDRSIVELVTGPTGIGLATLAVAGFAAVTGRRRLLDALDTQFFRQHADTKSTLMDVAQAVRQSTSIDDLRDALAKAVESAFHPETCVTAVAGSDDYLHAIDADLIPLRRASALAQLLGGQDAPLEIGAANGAIVDRLDANDREWLRVACAELVVPLRGASDQLLGVMALGAKKSELPYSDFDRKLLAVVASSGGLALERILTAARDAQRSDGSILLDPPARECVECGTVHDADAIACPCGGLLQRSPVPHTLGDRLCFVQRVGTGGMGVVYRALDLRLQQHRAVKTLPGTEPAVMARLRREAKSMASASHPNLATLHGLETWRGAPMLVMEFLDGGTLTDRLRRGGLSLQETFSIGTSVASALSVLHGAGLLHRDVKPSNIGFTAEGVPKLLDFGLVKLMKSAGTTGAKQEADDSTWSDSFSTNPGGIRGTPAYLSPEVLSGTPPTAEDDLWGLSVTMLEACTGTNPFRAATVAATVARVLTDRQRVAGLTATLPQSAQELFAELLGPADRRPHTAHQFVNRLARQTSNGG